MKKMKFLKRMRWSKDRYIRMTSAVFDGSPIPDGPYRSNHCGVYVDSTVVGHQSIIGLGDGLFIEGRRDVVLSVNAASAPPVGGVGATGSPPPRRVFYGVDGRVSIGETLSVSGETTLTAATYAQLEVIPLSVASNAALAFRSASDVSRRHVIRSDHASYGSPSDAVSFILNDGGYLDEGIDEGVNSNLGMRVSGVGVHVPAG